MQLISVPNCPMKFAHSAALALGTTITVHAVSLPLLIQRNHDVTSLCHVLPQDKEWPSWQQWRTLNESVEGRLIAGKPLASICYGEEADAAACAVLQNNWTKDYTLYVELLPISKKPFSQSYRCANPNWRKLMY